MRGKALLTLAVLVPFALVACDTEHSESCEWEQKKKITVSESATPKGQLILGKGGSSGSGGGRGGSSGSRSGGGVKMGKSSSSGGSGGASKPRFNKSNPAPKPKSSPKSGYVWSWDCD